MPKRHKSTEKKSRKGQDVVLLDEAPLPASRDLDVQLPFASQALFWRPRHAIASPATVHVPFLFWLVEAMQPRRIVQIGPGDGAILLALCQAIDKLRLPASCIAVADPNEPALPAPVAAAQAAQYAEMSFVVTGALAELPRELGITRIDLLVINRTFAGPELATLHDVWLPLLADGAVLVSLEPGHGSAHVPAAARQKATALPSPTIRMTHPACIAEISLIGRNPPERLRRLADLDRTGPAWLGTAEMFRRLGELALAEAADTTLPVPTMGTASGTRAALPPPDPEPPPQPDPGGLEKALAQSEARCAVLTSERDRLRGEVGERIDDIAALAADYETTIAELKTALAGSRSAATKAKQRESALATKHAQGEAALHETHAASSARLAQREAELAIARSQHSTSTRAHQHAQALLNGAQAELAHLKRALAEAEARRLALLESTSWRVTAPLRFVGRNLRS